MAGQAHADLTAAVDAAFSAARAALERLVRIPSIGAEGADTPPMRAAAEAVAALLADAGLEGVRLLDVPGAAPAVYAEHAGPAGAPTVLLYAHYDVQPVGDRLQWSTEPFEPVERAGRLYGRGASDDKAGIATHLAALQALSACGPLPVTVRIFFEGEEEQGSPHMSAFIERYGPLLRADVIVVADSEHWRAGEPALTTSLRGLVDCEVEVRTARAAVHSGQFGGAVPDALSALARLLATLHDHDGRVAIAGLVSAGVAPVDEDEAYLREAAGMLGDTQFIGEGPLSARLWLQPAVSVLAIDAPRISEAVNALVPVARAKVSVRLAPGQDPAAAMDALVAHIESHAAWGSQVTVTRGSMASPFRLDTSGAAFEAFRTGLTEAWGLAPVEIGVGGSIPLVAALAAAQPDAAILLTGVGEPQSRIHGPDESQDLEELRRGALAEAIALRLIGRL
ncbi:MAG: M20/M25/M40 family metallo-hydrolase [Chloroflexi bacterium]|nr:M20/M25/M40 family metallo-hydrolase [Chloroflexota bacterium]